MNYYEHHLGDYMRDTAHLSILEDGVYRRLIDAYYIREAPLPSELKKCYKLARAQSKSEREAVDSVLDEFFDLQPDGYHHKRCDEEIVKYQIKQEENNEKKENEADRQRRYRERRKQLYSELKSLGIVPSFNLNNSELETLLIETKSRTNHADVTSFVTRDTTANQTPDTRHQTPLLKPISPLINQGRTDGGEKSQTEHPKTAPTEPAHWVDYFNHHFGTAFGYKTQAQRKQIWPVLTAWCNKRITPEQINAAVSRALEDATEPIANLILYTDRVLASSQSKKAPALNWWSTEAGRKAKLEELGMTTRPGESNAALIARMTAEIERRAKS